MKEVIFIGLPGPTHNYGGLSGDNVAATTNRHRLSNPRAAALQAIALAEILQSLGQKVAFLPPQLRPHMPMLRAAFPGSDEHALAQAAQKNPSLLEAASSSSAMWTANAATVAPTVDTADGKLHLTVANLHTHPHRRIEAADTLPVLRAIFADAPECVVHPPLDAARGRLDEGAANHMRLSPSHGERGLHLFVYGPEGARQSLAASQAVAEQHQLKDALFIQQNPQAIAQGVFHNDVVAVSNESVLLAHEQAFAEGDAAFASIARAYARKLHLLRVAEADLTIAEAVATYFFNSQLVTLQDGNMALIAPQEVAEHARARAVAERIIAGQNPITQLHYVDLKQSMRNGGGPACLRLRVPMTEVQIEAVQKTCDIFASPALLQHLKNWVTAHYRESLSAADLPDIRLYQECQTALAGLEKLMRLPILPKET